MSRKRGRSKKKNEKEDSEELGDDMQSEIDEYEKKLEELKAPDVVKEKLEKEISRFKASAGNSAETGVLRTYIDTLFEMPWSKTSRDNKNIDKAAKILREDHYGLDAEPAVGCGVPSA